MNSELDYRRKFLILKSHYSNILDLKPKGHGRLQLRGQNLNLSFNIEGGEATNYYDILLIGRNKAHRIGSIYTDEKRSGNADFSIFQKDLEAWGFPLNKINGILIARNSNILLGGYFQKDDQTIDKYISSMEDQGPIEADLEEDFEEGFEDKLEEDFQVDYLEDNIELDNLMEEDLKEEDLVEETSPDEDLVFEEEIQEQLPSDRLVDEKDIMKKSTIDDQEYYSLDLDDIISMEEYSEALEEVFPQGQYPDPDFYENLHMAEEVIEPDTSLDHILNILNYFPYIEPFRIGLKGYSWWKIDQEGSESDLGFLPYFDYILSRDSNNLMIENSVTSSQLIKKYGHYIFGLFENKDGVRLYVYGIPGDFKLDEYPQAGTTGFNNWFEAKFKEKEAPGYWLLYLDARSGRILYPINPMIPME